MSINFRIKAVPIESFQLLFKLSDEELLAHHAKWVIVDSEPGYPCRVSLVDAKVGERALALSYFHHDVQSPYRESGPIFVRENAETAKPAVNEIPKLLYHRLLSVRAYDSRNFMIEALVVQGSDLEPAIENQLQNKAVQYLHIHNAGTGCFICAAYRA